MLVSRTENRTVSEARPLIQDLDALPFPAWHHLDLMKYFDGSKLYPYIDVFSGRGCRTNVCFVFGRKLCTAGRFGSDHRIEWVDELEHDL